MAVHLVILDRYVEIGSVIQSLGKARKERCDCR
jgi:hypothetical protein